MKKVLLIIITVLILAIIILFLYPWEEKRLDNISMAKKFLDTKTTNEKGLGCGPPDDWDCGYTRYQNYAIWVNSVFYRETRDSKYLDYAIKFANTRPTSPPDVCPNCICSMPDDFDCGNGEDQADTIYSFVFLYDKTGNKTYLDFAENVAENRPTGLPDWCKDCICGPPDDWDCGTSSIQSLYVEAYYYLYQVTNDTKYKAYMQNLLDEYQNKSAASTGAGTITIYILGYNATGNVTYLEIAKQKAIEFATSNTECMIPGEWQCPNNYKYYQGKIIYIYTRLYELTGEKEFLDYAVKFADAGSSDCGPTAGWACSDPLKQGLMIRSYHKIYRLTGETKYLDYFNKLTSMDSFEKIGCADYDCHDAEFNYGLGFFLLETA
ncbi:MAG: glycoside hydrolase family 127 protein [Candidatus Aenigmarchaeota archaeon]|nr:glycoside hydrolase family 127 protein [Candidatus Aenigmarchaeota archaeon]